MIKAVLYILFVVITLEAKVYYAKVEPIDILTIASNVQGEIVYVDEDALGKKLLDKPFIEIDDTVDKADLSALKVKIEALEAMIAADEEIVKNLQSSVARKEQNYESVKNLSVKSKTQKDAIYFDLIATKNQLLSTKKELENFRLQLSDLKAKEVRLLKSIEDKHIHYKGYTLYELLVKKGDVATPAKPLAKVADTSKAILTIFIDVKDMQGINQKRIYIDGKKSSYHISRVIPIADSVNISKYKVQIVINPPKIFSKLVKVELK